MPRPKRRHVLPAVPEWPNEALQPTATRGYSGTLSHVASPKCSIVGNAFPTHPYDIFQCNFFKELWEAVFCVNKEGFVDESLQVSRKRGFWR